MPPPTSSGAFDTIAALGASGVRRIMIQGQAGGESVSQSLLKDKAFSTFLDQNPPFELPPENGISPSTKACPAQWPVVDNSASSD
jgi:hypothetical protein